MISIIILLFSTLASCNEKHTHEFSTKYVTDAEHHWYECECGEKNGLSAHSWNNGIVTLQPTMDSEGEKTFTCTVCRYKKVDKVSKLDPDHIHEYTLDNHDELSHWQECDCGHRNNEETHSFDGGKLNSKDNMEYSCACGYGFVVDNLPEATAAYVLLTTEGELLDVEYTEMGQGGFYNLALPNVKGYLPEYDRCILGGDKQNPVATVYYSTVSTWDGVTVSESLSGSGTESDPFLIQSAADFAYLANDEFTGKHFKLTVSIDLDDQEFSISEFDGVLDGNHCSIRGININATANNAGLISTIKSNGRVYDLSLYGRVQGNETLGALAGTSHGRIENVVSFVTVNGSGKLGGIVGYSYGPMVGCSNYGNVTATLDYAGGVVGETKSSISNCANYGDITVRGRAGGIAYSSGSSIDNCVNYGSIKGSEANCWDLGGILGYGAPNQTASITNCTNFGNIKGATGIGGIFGFSDPTSSFTITDCVNNGNVVATWGGGGIVGNTNAVISGCVNNGKVEGSGQLGGIVGICSGKVTECTNKGTVSGSVDIIGGIVGDLALSTYGEIIYTTNFQEGTVLGNNSAEIIGKGYIHIEDDVESGPLTREEFEAQPSDFGSPWVNNNKRIKILMQIRMTKGTTITFLGDTSVYCWGVMETTDKENASEGAWKDSGWNINWADPNVKTYTTSYATGYFVLTVGKLDASGKPNLALTQEELDNIHSMFRVEGEKAGEGSGGSVNNPWLGEEMVSVNHRGWHEAPENTLSAYRESFNHGFKFVECDVQFTKDGIPVLLHDDTIDRTSDGVGEVSQLTYEQLLQYDFSYDSKDTVNDFSAYRGEKIPTFAEFIALCKELGLHPYIEIKGSISEDQAKLLVKIVSDAGMLDNVSWLSFSGDALAKIVNIDPTARVVWVLTDTYDTKIAANNIPFAEANLMTGESEVVFDLYYTLVKQSVVDLLSKYNIPLEVWTVNDINTIKNLHPYVSGVTSDCYNAKEVLSQSN